MKVDDPLARRSAPTLPPIAVDGATGVRPGRRPPLRCLAATHRHDEARKYLMAALAWAGRAAHDGWGGRHPHRPGAVEALKDGSDRSVCGDCVHRTADGAGSCYVNVAQAPQSVYHAWQRGA